MSFIWPFHKGLVTEEAKKAGNEEIPALTMQWNFLARQSWSQWQELASLPFPAGLHAVLGKVFVNLS